MGDEVGQFQPELGQMAFSNAGWGHHDLDWRIEQGLCVLADAIAIKRGDNDGLLISNYGAEPYEGEMFAMRSYCWCEGDVDGHEDGCPPNFEYFIGNFAVSWYKHVGRSGSQSRTIDAHEWHRIFRACLDEVTRPSAEDQGDGSGVGA